MCKTSTATYSCRYQRLKSWLRQLFFIRKFFYWPMVLSLVHVCQHLDAQLPAITDSVFFIVTIKPPLNLPNQ